MVRGVGNGLGGEGGCKVEHTERRGNGCVDNYRAEWGIFRSAVK